MTELLIEVSEQGITAIEIYCGDDVKYIEVFSTWGEMLKSISVFMPAYAYIRVRFRTSWED
jgi:hypothetical protein